MSHNRWCAGIGANTDQLTGVHSMSSSEARNAAAFDLTPPNDEQRRALEAGLTAEERDVLLHHGTEAPFCGVLLNNKHTGTYCCRLCGLPLFAAGEKFDSGTGWPSF